MLKFLASVAVAMALSGPALAAPPSAFQVKQCRLAADVVACAAKLDACLIKTNAKLDRLEVQTGAPINRGMALVYNCLGDQNVPIADVQ